MLQFLANFDAQEIEVKAKTVKQSDTFVAETDISQVAFAWSPLASQLADHPVEVMPSPISVWHLLKRP